jgi:hypothetical protein
LYELQVRNTGDYSGSVALDAMSLLGWNDSLEPTTGSLPVGGIVPATYGLTVPLGMSDPETGTSLITATLLCDELGVQDDVEMRTVSTKVALPAFLPVALRDYWDPSRWESEDNDSCSFEDADGPLLFGREYYGHPDDEADWFRIDFTASRLVIALTIENPFERGVQMGLYYDDCTCPDDPDWWDNTPENGYLIDVTPPPGMYFLLIFVGNPDDESYEYPYTLELTSY